MTQGTRWRWRGAACVLCAVLICIKTAVAAAAAADVLTIDDLLDAQELGRAAIDPTGHWLAYERYGPYRERPDFGVERHYTRDTGGKVYLLDLRSNTAVPQPLFADVPDSSQWICGFSPNGSRLAVYSVRKGEVHLVIHDLSDGREVEVDAAPQITWQHDTRPVWLDEDRLVFAALPAGRQPLEISVRRATGAALSRAWEQTWTGRAPSVRDVSSRAMETTSQPMAGEMKLFDARDGSLRTLAQGLFADLKLDPKGHRLAALRQWSWPRRDPRDLEDWSQARLELWVYDLRSGVEQTPPPLLTASSGSLEWSMDGSRLAFFGWGVEQPLAAARFHVFEPDRGRVEAWTHYGLEIVSQYETDWIRIPERTVWLEGRLAVVARPLQDKRKYAFSYYDPLSAARLPAAHWMLLDSQGRSRTLTAGLKDVGREVLGADADGFHIFAAGDVWRVDERGARKSSVNRAALALDRAVPLQPVFAYDREIRPYEKTLTVLQFREDAIHVALAADPRRVAAAAVSIPANAQVLAVSPQSGTVVYRRKDRGLELHVQRTSGNGHRIEVMNEYLRERRPAVWRDLSYTLPSGRTLTSCLLLPADYDPERRYATVVEIYPSVGGGHCSDPQHIARNEPRLPLQMTSISHLLAANGYVVLVAASPEELQKTDQGPFFGMAPLVDAAVDAAIAQGVADSERVGLMGLSQGGFASLWTAGHSDRFKAVLSISGWTDLWSSYFEGGIDRIVYFNESDFVGHGRGYETTQGVFGLGTTPWQDRARYLASSPLTYADHIAAPVLMIHSDMDFFGAVHQYEAMFTALNRLNKPARLLTYWGEGHALSSPANIRHAWEVILRWFDTYLKAEREGGSGQK